MAGKSSFLSMVVLLAAHDARRDPIAFLRKLERGDADSSGSTLRTLGIVILVVAVVTVIGAAVIAAANTVAGNISSTTFSFK